MYGRFVRLLFALLGAYLGFFVPRVGSGVVAYLVRVGGVFLGIVVGLAVAKAFCKYVLPRWEHSIQKMSIQEVISAAIGLCFGLVISGLIVASLPGTRTPGIIGNGLAVFILLLSVGISMIITIRKRDEIFTLFGMGKASDKNLLSSKQLNGSSRLYYKVLDTSAIIDGRIADLCETGFLEGVLIIPGFVLAELQRIADSSDSLKRNRGRRGLDILNRMQKDSRISVKIFDKDFDDLTEVDTKIVRLARMLDAKVVTNDFNLNKVSELYGVPVLNINELSNAIKPVVLPGEEMLVHIIKDGKEYGQGVAYLEDGTMIVVDGGKQYIGEELPVVVTSVLQTAAGRMIFAKPREMPASIRTSIS